MCIYLYMIFEKKRFFDASMMVCVCVWNNGCAKWRQESLSKEVYNELYFFLLRRIYFGMCRDYMTGIEMNAEIRRIRICGILSSCQNGWTTTLNRVLHNHTRNVWYMVTRANTYIDKQTNTFSLLGFDPDLVGKKGRKLVDRYFRACLFNIRLLYI